MPTTLRTRKPVVELSLHDLEMFPVWEYASDEEGQGLRDETYVRPVLEKDIRNGTYSQIVAASFYGPSGNNWDGFMIITTASSPVEIRPGAIVSKHYAALPAVSRQVAVAENYSWSLKERERVVKVLQSQEEQVFPLQYRLKVRIQGEAQVREGMVD